jgi:fucose 4-O-acetylase-like acetyltransferase
MGALAVVFDLLMSNPLKAVSEFQGVLYGTGHTLRFTPLWFLPCLFLVSMSATLLLSLHQRWLARAASAQENTRFLLGVSLISAVVGTVVVTSGRFGRPPFEDVLGRPLGLPWSLDLLPLVLAFFALGVLLASARFLRNCPQPWVVIAVAVAILLPLVANGVSLDLNYRRMTHPLGVAAGIAAGVALVIALSTLIARHGLLARLFSYLGSASLVVLMFHGAVQRRLMDQLAPWVSNEIALAALGATLTVAAICAVDLVVLRRIPALGWVCYPRRAAARAA